MLGKKLNKKAQVTIFIILALIIVVSVVLIILLMQGPKDEPTVADETDPQSYIENCVKDSLEEVVQILMKQGGYVDPLPLDYKLYEDEKVSYLCYNDEPGKECFVLESDLELHLEEEINNYLEPRIESCFSTLETALKEKNYLVSVGDMSFETKIEPGQVVVEINREFESTKRGNQQKIDNFRLGYIYPVKELSFHTMKILTNEAFLGNCYDNNNIRLTEYSIDNPPLIAERVLMGENNWIYTLTMNEFKFKFAIRSCVSSI